MLHRAVRPIGFIEPCQPTSAHKPPSGPGWLHEIKHDGYQLMARRVDKRVRLFTRNGNDWSKLFPRSRDGGRATRYQLMPDR